MIGPGSESVPVAALAAHLPEPGRPFWWFSATPLPDRSISAGQPVQAPPGSRLPAEADYWAHEGDRQWVKVDRSVHPKPEPRRQKKKARTVRKH